jgi:hypothetical protein
MEETLPQFAMGKRVNLVSVAASLWEALRQYVGLNRKSRRPPDDGYSACLAHKHCIKRFDISQATALRLNP